MYSGAITGTQAIWIQSPCPKFLGSTTPRVNCDELWVIMMCQHGFISYNQCTILLGEVDNREAVHEQGRGDMGNLCTFLSILL